MRSLLDIVNRNVFKKSANFDIKLKNVGQATLLHLLQILLNSKNQLKMYVVQCSTRFKLSLEDQLIV